MASVFLVDVRRIASVPILMLSVMRLMITASIVEAQTVKTPPETLCPYSKAAAQVSFLIKAVFFSFYPKWF